MQNVQKRPVLGVINTNTAKGQSRRNDGKGGVPDKPLQKKTFTVHCDDASDNKPTTRSVAVAGGNGGGLVLRGGKKLDAAAVAATKSATTKPDAATKSVAAAAATKSARPGTQRVGLRALPVPTATVSAATAALAATAIATQEEKLNLSCVAAVPRQPLKDLKVVAAREEEPMSEDSFAESPMHVDRSLVLSPCTPLAKPAAKPRLASHIFDIVEYQEEIFDYLKKAEMRSRAKPYYMRRQPDISYSMRAVLVDWLVEVGEEYKLQTETLYLAVSFIDRFLSQMSVVRAKLQLLGTAAMFVASKYEEIYPPDVAEFVFITDDTYNTNQVLKMEHVILKVLAFDLSIPTPLAFLNHLAVVCDLPDKTKHLAMYLCELSLLEADPYLQFRQSLVACAAIACARHCLLDDGEEGGGDGETVWPRQLTAASGYTLKQLAQCMLCLNNTHAKAASNQQQAINDKYKANKWHNVSEIAHKQLTVGENDDEKVILDL